jgi:hypothetical protein
MLSTKTKQGGGGVWRKRALAAEFLYVQVLCEEQRLHYPHQTEQKFVENKRDHQACHS